MNPTRLLLFAALTLSLASAKAAGASYPEFSWKTVPVAFHFGKNGSLMTAEEAAFVASRSNFICLEKGHATKALDTTEAGIEAEARQLKKLNPKMKVIFYWNAFLDYRMYEAHRGSIANTGIGGRSGG